MPDARVRSASEIQSPFAGSTAHTFIAVRNARESPRSAVASSSPNSARLNRSGTVADQFRPIALASSVSCRCVSSTIAPHGALLSWLIVLRSLAERTWQVISASATVPGKRTRLLAQVPAVGTRRLRGFGATPHLGEDHLVCGGTNHSARDE